MELFPWSLRALLLALQRTGKDKGQIYLIGRFSVEYRGLFRTSHAVFCRTCRASQNTRHDLKYTTILNTKPSNKRYITQMAGFRVRFEVLSFKDLLIFVVRFLPFPQDPISTPVFGITFTSCKINQRSMRNYEINLYNWHAALWNIYRHVSRERGSSKKGFHSTLTPP